MATRSAGDRGRMGRDPWEEARESRPLARDPEVQRGEPTFPRTRTPARILLDYVEGGYTLDAFLDDFPQVERADAVALLDGFRAALPGLARDVPGLDAALPKGR